VFIQLANYPLFNGKCLPNYSILLKSAEMTEGMKQYCFIFT